MAPPAYYNYPQAPGQYQDAVMKAGIYEEVESAKEQFANPRLEPLNVAGVPATQAAYLVCFYMFCESLVILIGDAPHNLAMDGPMKSSEGGFLSVLGWGDLVFAVAGSVGIWFSHNITPTGWRQYAKMHSTIAVLGVGSILAWRGLVCLSFAPWAGIFMAFHSPHADEVWMYVLVMMFILWNIFLVYVLAMAFRQSVSITTIFQQHLDLQAIEERRQLLTHARQRDLVLEHNDVEHMNLHEVEPSMFGCLPMAEAVAAYTVVVTLGCLWATIHFYFTGQTSGGWAFFAHTPQVSETFWLEIFLWPVSLVSALFGVSASSSLCRFGHQKLDQFKFDDVQRAGRSLFNFLIGSMLRYGLMFAVTGMDLVEKNTCGFYVNGFATLSSRHFHDPSRSFLIHCGGQQLFFLAAVALFCVLDGYFIWGTYQLWLNADAVSSGTSKQYGDEDPFVPHN